jgi:ABC-type dipeptide/oligopeptide/nickel transport system permease component
MIVLRGFATALPVIAGVIVVTFLLTRALPGDPAVYFAGPAATEQAITEIRHQLGFDRSLPVQFLDYTDRLVHGDLGTSLTTGQPVLSDLLTRLPASAELTLLALFLAVAVALPLGIPAAMRLGSPVDHVCRIVTTAGVSLPTFFTGLLLIYVFYYLTGLAPSPLGLMAAVFCFNLMGDGLRDIVDPRRRT